MAGKKKKASATSVSNGKETTKSPKKDGWLDRYTKEEITYGVAVLVIACVFGVIHKVHIYGMFERQRFFSHLSTLERELSFRTEMGLYYSYYKSIAEAPTYVEGLKTVIQDNITEYPDTVNVLRRFNLHPELFMGTAYRLFTWFTEANKIHTKDCYTINRGNGMAQVQSCEGFGDIAYFYVMPIFWLNGFLVSLLFVLGCYISNNLLGGFLVVASYFFNHGECTRVMWTPPLRESFSFPFMIAQILTLVYVLRAKFPSLKHGLQLAFVTICFMLPWQFAQFALLTQTCAIFGLYMLQFIDSKKTIVIIFGLWFAHLTNFVMQFANTLLISSFFMACMAAVLLIVLCEDVIEKLRYRVLIWAVQAIMFLSCSFTIKVATAKFFGIKDDTHIFDILKSKFSDFKNFHTLLYVCAPEFDFITREYPEKLFATLLMPAAGVAALVTLFLVLKYEWGYWIKREPIQAEHEGESLTKPYTVHLYLILQAIAYLLMTTILMRMKLFGTPGLCILTAVLASREIFGFIKSKQLHYGLIVLLIAGMAVKGYENINSQLDMKGEYNNPEQEKLMEWIKARTSTDAVFAGSMPTMATVKLTTGRPIVNHPHYEDSGLRARTKRVYQIFSRKSNAHVYNELRDMHVNYIISDVAWCNRETDNGCALSEVWDNEDIENRGKEPACRRMQREPAPFSKVYDGESYQVFRL